MFRAIFLAAKSNRKFQLLHTGVIHVYNQTFFTNVLRMMEEQGMNKFELAQRVEMSPSLLSDLTNGRASPFLKVMGALLENHQG